MSFRYTLLCGVFLLLIHSFFIECKATENPSSQQKFNLAKQLLSQRKIKQAIPLIESIKEKDPKNANLNYLLAVCYTELNQMPTTSIKLLKLAQQHVSLDYDPNSYEERSAPIHVYHYLSLAHCQNNNCALAEEAQEKFKSLSPFKDTYYLSQSNKWLKVCKGSADAEKTVKLISSTPTNNVTPQPSELSTRRVNYTTDIPLYGVQIGAFKEAIPVNRYAQLKNVSAFLDKKGWIRYVVGKFSIPSQAETLKETLFEKGYHDAHVVNVNDEIKFSNELLSVNGVNIKKAQYGSISYKVQIGAFKETVAKEIAEAYLKIDGIEEVQDGDYTLLTIGDFEQFDEAKALSMNLPQLGIDDSFVVAFLKEKKIPLEEASQFVQISESKTHKRRHK